MFSGDISDAAALKKRLSAIIPVDDEFKKAFEIATVSKASFARYYLRSLEMAAKNEATPWFIPNDDKQAINLEHVLPEVPDGSWLKIDPDATQVFTKRIGNLALLLAKSNSDLRSSGFAVKKSVYLNSPYELTRQIGQVKNWGPGEIIERQKGLAQLALRAWPL